MKIEEMIHSVPDLAKVSVATGSTVFTIVGLPVEQWMYILSAIVSIMFIVEKFPVFVTRMKQLYGRITRK